MRNTSHTTTSAQGANEVTNSARNAPKRLPKVSRLTYDDWYDLNRQIDKLKAVQEAEGHGEKSLLAEVIERLTVLAASTKS
jgi:hypothetical protein